MHLHSRHPWSSRVGASAGWAVLPYGLQRRVELARALATEPQLLLLDEPAAGLNPQETAELGKLIVEISKLGITILMVEHHMDLVMSISDHVIVLDYGIENRGRNARCQFKPTSGSSRLILAPRRRKERAMLKLESVEHILRCDSGGP